MTTNLLLMLLPVGLLLIVSGLCFVGCVLDVSGLPPDFTTYSATDIIPNIDCVAYWRLDDEGGTAHDSKGGNEGQYIDKTAMPAQFPSPSYTAGGFRSAAAAVTLTLAQSGSRIVNGDSETGGSQAPAMQTDGAYVLIAANGVTKPAGAFSAEAWIKTGWDASDSDAVHTFLDFRNVDAAGAISGFAMLVDNQGQLGALVGRGAAGELNVTGSAVPLQTPAHVVLTFENGTASLFVNGSPAGQSPLNPGESYVPNTTGQQSIGAGAPFAPPRTDQTAALFFPAFPFKGSIQDVAIYKIALSPKTIMDHFTHGSGNKTS